MCEAWRFEGLTGDVHTARVHFRNTRIEPDYSIKKIAYLLMECCIITRCTGVCKARPRMTVIPLTIQPPDLKPYREVLVLRNPFRKAVLCCGGGRTARKIANTTRSSTSAVRQAILSTHPMISSLSRSIRSFKGEMINVAEGSANKMAYLVHQCQKKVIEEEGGNRN